MSSPHFNGILWALLYGIARAWEATGLPLDSRAPRQYMAFLTRLMSSAGWHDDFTTVSISETELMAMVDGAYESSLGEKTLNELKRRIRENVFMEDTDSASA